VQAKLQKLGYHSGAVDGQLGPVTSASIRSYQEKNGLEVTGRIDKPLLGSLEL
jgi:peptidoglycan hydrolase-like protein with peptidoglycan-binding domain